MRISKKDLAIIRQAFNDFFTTGDCLWLFGSRTNALKKGGDIDLYIETTEDSYPIVYRQKTNFWLKLQEKLGEQKIDIVVKRPSDNQNELIYQEARQTGILIMKKISPLQKQIEIIDIHKKRLKTALVDSTKLLPITAHTFSNLTDENAYIFEMLNSRFGKMQDDIGSKIFPIILKATNALSLAFIDNLNTLEKLEILPSASWWQELRSLKNEIAHDYDTKHDSLAEHTNELLIKSQELIDFWEKLKPITESLYGKY